MSLQMFLQMFLQTYFEQRSMTTVPAAWQFGVSMVSAENVEPGGEQLKVNNMAPPPAGASSVVMSQSLPLRAGIVWGFRKLTLALPAPLPAPDGPVELP